MSSKATKKKKKGIELSRTCGLSDLYCNAAQTLMGQLCDLYITKNETNVSFCDTLRKVVAIRFDREKKLQTVGERAFEYYQNEKKREKYSKMDPEKRRQRLELLIQNSLKFQTEEINKRTMEEEEVDNAINQHSGILKQIAKGLASDVKMQELYEKVQQESGMSTWKSIANYLYYYVQSTVGWCVENKLKCLALVVLIAAILFTMFFPTLVFSTISSVLTNILGSFFYRLGGLTYKITKITNAAAKEESHRLEQRSDLRRTWDTFISPWVTIGKVVKSKVTRTPLTRMNAVSFIDETLSLLPFVDGVVAPILGQSASIKSLIQTAYNLETAYILLQFSANFAKCYAAPPNTKVVPCTGSAIQFAGIALKTYIRSKWGDKDLEDSAVIALAVEGTLVSEMFWAAVDYAAYKNIFPSFIGNRPHEQLKFVSYVRLGVRIIDLFNTTRSLGPIWMGDKSVDMKVSTMIIEQVFMQKATALSGHAGGLMWQNSDDIFWGSSTNYFANPDALKEELNKDKKFIDEAMKKVRSGKDILTRTKAICDTQLTQLDATTMDLMNAKEMLFTDFAKQIKMGPCSVQNQIVSYIYWTDVEQDILVPVDKVEVCWKTLKDDERNRHTEYGNNQWQAFWVVEYFDKYTAWLHEILKYIGIIPREHPIHEYDKSTMVDSKSDGNEENKSNVDMYYDSLKQHYDERKTWLDSFKGLNSANARKRKDAYENLKAEFENEVYQNTLIVDRTIMKQAKQATTKATKYIEDTNKILKERRLIYKQFEETVVDGIADRVENDILEATVKAMEDQKNEKTTGEKSKNEKENDDLPSAFPGGIMPLDVFATYTLKF